MHWLEDDLPPDRTDLTRPDRHRAVRRRERHLGRLARCVLQGDQPLNPRHRHHPLNAGVSMSVPHLAPRGKSQDNTNPPVGAMNLRSPEEPVGDSADGEPAPGLPVASSTPRIWASHPASRLRRSASGSPSHTRPTASGLTGAPPVTHGQGRRGRRTVSQVNGCFEIPTGEVRNQSFDVGAGHAMDDRPAGPPEAARGRRKFGGHHRRRRLAVLLRLEDRDLACRPRRRPLVASSRSTVHWPGSLACAHRHCDLAIAKIRRRYGSICRVNDISSSRASIALSPNSGRRSGSAAMTAE